MQVAQAGTKQAVTRQEHREAGQVATGMGKGVEQDTGYTGGSEVTWCPAKCTDRGKASMLGQARASNDRRAKTQAAARAKRRKKRARARIKKQTSAGWSQSKTTKFERAPDSKSPDSKSLDSKKPLIDKIQKVIKAPELVMKLFLCSLAPPKVHLLTGDHWLGPTFLWQSVGDFFAI